jgi:GTP cyclohydrolase I
VGGYDEIVLLKDIPFNPIASIICADHRQGSHRLSPAERVVGISKLARVLHGFARRLQVQERLTAQSADCVGASEPQVWRSSSRRAMPACPRRGVNTPA